jgi:hypothetical protein
MVRFRSATPGQPRKRGFASRRLPLARSLRRATGVAMISIAGLGVWWVVQATNHLEPYLLTVSAAPAGTRVADIEFELAYLSAPGVSLPYLSPATKDAIGELTLDVALPAGSLVDQRLVGAPPPADSTTFTIELDIGGAPWLKAGEWVEIWVAAPLEDQAFSVPIVASPRALVTGVRTDEGFAADSSRVTVDLLVPRRGISTLIHAKANSYSIQLSPVTTQALVQ